MHLQNYFTVESWYLNFISAFASSVSIIISSGPLHLTHLDNVVNKERSILKKYVIYSNIRSLSVFYLIR